MNTHGVSWRLIAICTLIGLLSGAGALADDPAAGIVQGPDGEPLSGATVSLVQFREDFVPAFDIVEEAKTDTGGRFTLKLTTDQAGQSDYVTLYIAHHPDYGAQCRFRADIRRAGGFSNIEFSLSEGAPVAGTVVSQSGSPVKGAEVHAFMSTTRPSKGVLETVWESREVFKTETDASGRFVLNGLAKDSLVSLRVRHPQFAPTLFALKDDCETPTGELIAGGDDVQIVLDPGIPV